MDFSLLEYGGMGMGLAVVWKMADVLKEVVLTRLSANGRVKDDTRGIVLPTAAYADLHRTLSDVAVSNNKIEVAIKESMKEIAAEQRATKTALVIHAQQTTDWIQNMGRRSER